MAQIYAFNSSSSPFSSYSSFINSRKIQQQFSLTSTSFPSLRSINISDATNTGNNGSQDTNTTTTVSNVNDIEVGEISGSDDNEGIEEDNSNFHSNYRHAKRSPNPRTCASQIGVKNFINVIRSLHRGEEITYFPITKKTLEEYLNYKCKDAIKSDTLNQYLQHIKNNNISLGFGWDGEKFGPIIKKALDKLTSREKEA